MKSQVEVHLQENDYDDDFEPNDFMDVFLLEKARKERNGEDTSEEFNLEELQGICIDLWIAGQETTSSALQWIFAYLIHNQEVQQKLHRELDEIIGSDRLITSLDKSNLNYVNAVVAEGFRCGNLLTFNIPHATTREVEIEGFKVPQGTVVVPQLSTSLVDERVSILLLYNLFNKKTFTNDTLYCYSTFLTPSLSNQRDSSMDPATSNRSTSLFLSLLVEGNV